MPELILPGSAGRIEARYSPRKEDTAPIALILAPHPRAGGHMNHPVAVQLFHLFMKRGFNVLRFNFRGVGGSAGSYDEGRGEEADALAVIAYGRTRWPQAALWLGGFSFGAAVTVLAAASAQPARLVLVAPGITKIDVSQAAPPTCPWLIVQGDADEVVPADVVLGWAAQLTPAPQIALLPGAGHFFHGRINELREAVLRFMTP